MGFFQVLKHLSQGGAAHGFGHEKSGSGPGNRIGNGVELVGHFSPLRIVQGQILPQSNQALLFDPGLNPLLGIRQRTDFQAAVRLRLQGLKILCQAFLREITGRAERGWIHAG